jgi:outer membrane protein assembly complex protein YaeT
MRYALVLLMTMSILAGRAAAQAVDVQKPEEKQKEEHAISKAQEKKAQHTNTVEFEGQRAFDEKELRSQLKEQLSILDEYGLTSARADDVAFFVELFYRKHGYTKVSVRYKIESSDRLRLIVNEGSVMTLGNITFDGNVHEPTEKLFEFIVGPTRERYSKLQKNLPFVEADVQEGVNLVERLYNAEGFLDAKIDKATYQIHEETNTVDVVVPIREGRQYFFGDVSFSGKKIYDAETLRGQIVDLLDQPYTDARVADIPRRLQSYFKTRGYYDVKVDASGEPTAAENGHVPVRITIAPGPVYRFGEASVTGLTRLNPSFVTKRFDSLAGQTYSPEMLDEKFRTLMRTGLFNLLQIKPTPAGSDTLRLAISAEEAKSKAFGVSVGYGTYEGFIGGLEFSERDLFGTGRPITFSVEVSQRGYKGEILYEDYFLFDTDVDLRNRLGALTFDFDGYSKFELGDRIELTKKITKQYELGLIFTARHVEITSAEIKTRFLGDTSYFIDTLGFTQTLDLRESPLVAPRGFVANTTLDIATAGLGSEVDLIRGTFRLGYYLPFGPKSLTPGVVEDKRGTPLQRWFQQSGIAFGARAGLVHSLNNSGPDEATTLPIDERFFNGGATSVRSFGERQLGPLDKHGNPLGGEFYTVFNVEYTFPIFGELQGAIFTDAGNLSPTSENPGLTELRYAVGGGLRYRLPIGPIRLDYGVNPDRRPGEDFGAFHFSFGFAF